jgi:hypothetical protein
LGDIVETELIGARRYVVNRVVRSSGRYVFRAWFGESFQPRDEVADALTDMGALLEWSSVNLLAVDASDGTHAKRIADFLSDRESRGQPIYEAGRR